MLDVKVLGKNEKGQLRLSRRAVLLRDSSANVASPIVATAIASTAAAAIAASVTSTPEVASSTVAN